MFWRKLADANIVNTLIKVYRILIYLQFCMRMKLGTAFCLCQKVLRTFVPREEEVTVAENILR
jgi:hypothetical protein